MNQFKLYFPKMGSFIRNMTADENVYCMQAASDKIFEPHCPINNKQRTDVVSSWTSNRKGKRNLHRETWFRYKNFSNGSLKKIRHLNEFLMRFVFKLILNFRSIRKNLDHLQNITGVFPNSEGSLSLPYEKCIFVSLLG